MDGSYFFGRGLGDREKASFFPATIAYQLSRSKSSCRDAIKKTIDKRPTILSESFSSQFRQLLIKTAEQRWSFKRPITIVIDALDECDDADDQVELLKLILEAVTTTNMWVLIASRPEQQIHSFFQQKNVSQHTYHVRLDEESFNTSRDIEIFLRGEFARIRSLKPELCRPLPNGEDWPGNAVIIQIRDDSDSQFIFPTLAIAYIDTPFYAPDQQLQTLLLAPPPHAFSKLDALYERILSRCPPELHEGGDELVGYQKLVLEILAVVVAWSEPVSATTIAGVLKKKVDVVQNIVLGPMRSLFKLDASKTNSPITLCHKSLRDYLLDVKRSRQFFVPSADAGILFISILSRRPPRDHSYSREELIGVLEVMVNWPGELTSTRIAEVLEVDETVVQNVILGPAKSLFHIEVNKVRFSTSSIRPFLQNVECSGEFFIRHEDHDSIFTRVLSRQPPSDPLSFYSRDDLLDVLTTLVAGGGHTSKREIGMSLLGLDPVVAKRVVLGPSKALFNRYPNGKISFSARPLKSFLQDANRSGRFFIQGRADAIFIRIMSRPLPSDILPSGSHSREVLLGVLTVVMELGYWVNVQRIASFLDLALPLVEAVIFGPTKALFKLDNAGNINFAVPSFKEFLLDDKRAGEYWISKDRPDALFIEILSRRPPPSFPYSRDTLMDVLMVLVVSLWRLSELQIASILNVGVTTVENVVFGPAESFFDVDIDGIRLPRPLELFLQDPSRAQEFYIPPRDVNPKHGTLHAKIEKIHRGHQTTSLLEL